MPAVDEKQDSKLKMEISQQKVKEAVGALKLLNKKFAENDLKKQPLLEDIAESPVYLQVALKKIPPSQLIKMIRVPLPHSLVTETSEVCLITGDLDKRNHKAEVEPTILHYKDLLRKQGVTKVSQVIPLRQLRTEYKTYESKRQLSAAYDVFLVDKKIAGVMAKTLGKSFFQNRKFPIQIDMKRPNLKDQIDKALCQTEFSLTCRGNSCALEIARLSMDDEAIAENIKTCIEILESKLPGKRENIMSLYLKTAKSKAIPIYVSLDIPDNMLIKKPRKNDKCKIDELSTIDNVEVKVFRDGKVIVRKKKESSDSEDCKKIDSNNDLMESEEDTQEFNKVSLKQKKKNKKTSDVAEIKNDTEIDNEEDFQDSTNASDKKKKKSKKTTNSVKIMENEENNQDSNANIVSPKKKKKGIKFGNGNETTDNVETENEAIQDLVSAEISTKKKKKGKKIAIVDGTTDIVETENEEIQDLVSAETSSKKRKKGKKIAMVDGTTDIVETENEAIQDLVSAEISTKKRKKGKKIANVDGTTDIVENEEIQDYLTAEISMKKKKKDRISILDKVSDMAEMECEKKTHNFSLSSESLKKKNKNKNSSNRKSDRKSISVL